LRQHGNKHVDEHDDHAATIRAEHEFPDELGQVMSLAYSEHFDGRQAVDGEVERLYDLEQTAQTQSYHPRSLRSI